MFGFLVNVILLPEDSNSAIYLEEVPIDVLKIIPATPISATLLSISSAERTSLGLVATFFARIELRENQRTRTTATFSIRYSSTTMRLWRVSFLRRKHLML